MTQDFSQVGFQIFFTETKIMTMKKLSILIIVSTIAFASNAQVSGGAKAGMNLSTFRGYPGDAGLRPGFHLGAYLNFAFNEKLSFQPELLFNSAGTKIDDKEFDYTYKSTIKLSYLSLPMSLQYSLGRFNIHAGPQVSLLLAGKEDYTISYFENGLTYTESYNEDVKDVLKSVDLGLNFGAGVSFGKVGMSARYSMGLVAISDEADDYDYQLTNSAFQFSVLYKLIGN